VRGTNGRIYPWGNQWDARWCNSKEGPHSNTTPVTAHPEAASPYRLLDGVGNVWEWTRSVWRNYPYPASLREQVRRENLRDGQNKARVRRGWPSDDFHTNLRCAYRDWGYSNLSDRSIGFRVVMHP
jgi:formylglycine-generating enzyme required for sulfatase activity